jgi:signal transduction histidine kinase
MPNPRTTFEALARRRFLLGGWPWRSLAYLISTVPVALTAAIALGLLALPWAAVARKIAVGDPPSAAAIIVFTVLGAVFLGGLGPLVALPLAALERLRLGLVDDRPVLTTHRSLPMVGGFGWLRARFREPGTVRDLIYALLLATVLPVLYLPVGLAVLVVVALLTSPLAVAGAHEPVTLGLVSVHTVGQSIPYAILGLVLLPALPYLFALLAGVHATVARALLHDGSGLPEVSQSRARLVDAFDVERRRIERDLHDGAQQRLVGLTLQLGMARLDLPAGSPAAVAVADAHQQAKQLMGELREFIHGIHPQILTDSGLPAALGELAERGPIPVRLHCDLPERPPERIEATAYFAVSEALANVVRHSGATQAGVSAVRRKDLLVVEVGDNGRGGAVPGPGTGLTGLADRAVAVGGRMSLSSPVGGPTLVRLELPWSA